MMPPSTRPAGLWGLLRNGPAPVPPRQRAALPTLRLEPFSREHGGKTALRSCLSRGPLLGAQNSGLELTAADPRVLNKWTREAIERFRDLRVRGLTSTPEPSVTEYLLCQADNPCALLQWRDSVGQLLTHTDPDSPEAQQNRWEEMIEQLAQADVLLPLVNCPPRGNPADLERFEGELQLQAAILRAALLKRPGHRPVAVGIAVNKLDAGFTTDAEAREALPDERLRTALARLVRLVEGSSRVGLGAIIPVSAFGFGTAVPAPEEPGGTSPDRVRGLSPLSEGDIEWLLKSNVSPEPFNLTGLAWWCLMAGLMLQPADDRREDLTRLARLLADDLKAMNAWLVPLHCRDTSEK